MELRTKQQLKYIVSDFIAGNLAFLCFDFGRYHYLKFANPNIGELHDFLLQPKLIAEQVLIPFVFLFIYWLSGYYSNPFNRSRLQEFSQTAICAIINTLLIYLALLTNEGITVISISYKILLMLLVLLFGFTYAGRYFLTNQSLRQIRKNRWTFKTIVIGPRRNIESTRRQLRESLANLGFIVEGRVVTDGEPASPGEAPLPEYDVEDLQNICSMYKIEQLIFSPGDVPDTVLMEWLYKLFPLNIPIKITPDTFSYVTASIHLKDIQGEPFVDLTSPKISHATANIKRTCDVVISAVVLLILAIPMLILALFVKRDSPGPAFYRQTRSGLHRKPFSIIKFRTMRSDAEKDGPRLTVTDDDRITRIGRWMRKYRIDELPQFYNVLRGDMSLVGPRPEREFYIRQITERAPYYTLVHQVRPGITSWGMVKFGYASSVDEMIERTRYDLIYLANMSISVDLKILIYTIKTVVTGEGK